MNATNLYVSTCRLVMQANSDDPTSWADLHRLVPYLRQSLSCTVCGNLLIEPYTPTETNCQHHVCKSCKGGKKKLKPSCSWCKDYDKYIENVQLRILLQCYKKLCEYIISSAIYKKLSTVNNSVSNANTNLLDGTTPTLTNLIQEGAGFADEFRSSRSPTFLLSCVHTNSTSTQTNSASMSTQTNSASLLATNTENTTTGTLLPSNGETESTNPVHNGSTVYSVLYAGSGNKLTFKRKASESTSSDNHDSGSLSPVKALSPPPKPAMGQAVQPSTNSGITQAKKQARGKSAVTGAVKTGCRCGNATAVPGKLTCCGQRCACYTESKPCVDCKCRGCRNPHTADGQKLCNYQLLAELADDPLAGPQCVSLASNDLVTTAGGTVQVVGVYTTQLHNLTSTPLLLDANTTVTTLSPEETTGDVDVSI